MFGKKKTKTTIAPVTLTSIRSQSGLALDLFKTAMNSLNKAISNSEELKAENARKIEVLQKENAIIESIIDKNNKVVKNINSLLEQ